jgi:hypothetical protein
VAFCSERQLQISPDCPNWLTLTSFITRYPDAYNFDARDPGLSSLGISLLNTLYCLQLGSKLDLGSPTAILQLGSRICAETLGVVPDLGHGATFGESLVVLEQ